MHTDPDAPLIHLLSIKHNPLLIAMSDQQLREYVIQLRTPPKAKTKAKVSKKEPKLSLAARRAAIRDAI
jgi:hypothetical protein